MVVENKKKKKNYGSGKVKNQTSFIYKNSTLDMR